MIEWIKYWWNQWRTDEMCGKWFGEWQGTSRQYCTRKHNHHGHHKEKR